MAVFISGSLFFTNELSAQLWTPPGAKSKPPTQFFTYDVGVNKIKEDTFLYVAPSFNFDIFSTTGVSLTVPLNILIQDKAPLYTNSKRGMIRPEDYANKSGYLRVINYIWYGTFGEYKPGKVTYSVYAGKIFDAFIGHGTIVHRYVNNQNINSFKAGILADVNSDFGGAQVFTNSIYDREVNSGRVYIRPFAMIFKAIDLKRGVSGFKFFQIRGKILDDAGRNKVKDDLSSNVESRYIEIVEDPVTGKKKEVMKNMPSKKEDESNKNPLFSSESWWNRFSIGYTSAYDARAPLALNLDSTGQATYENTGYLSIKTAKRVKIQGYDAEYKLITNKFIEVTPYYDVNKILNVDNSKGIHSGVFSRIGGKKIKLMYQPEYRNMTASYIPTYFDSYYEIERYQYNLTSSVPYTKMQYLNNLDPKGDSRKGLFQSVTLDVYRYVVQMEYEDYTGPNNSKVFMGFYIPIGKMFLLSGYYNKKNFEKQSEAFKVDNRSTGAVELGINIFGVMVKLQNYRTWQFDTATNKYAAVDQKRILFSGAKTF